MRIKTEASSARWAAASMRSWLLVGFLGLVALLCANPAYDAWSLNRAGVLVNRAVVTGTTADLTTAKALMEQTALRGPLTAERQTRFWRTYGAAAALAPNNKAFSHLLEASSNGWLDRIGELWLGEVAWATGHWETATDAYQRVDASNLLISQGDSYLQSGEKELAVRSYELAQTSLTAAMERDTAQSLLSETIGEGKSLAAGLMTSAAERVTALYRIGRGLLAAGDADAALPVLEDAYARSQTATPGAMVAQSLRLNLAMALARTLPDRPQSLATTHVAYYPNKDSLDYVHLVTRIRGLVSTSTASDRTASVCVQAARILLVIGDDETAVALLEEALQLDPLLADAYLLLGGWYESKGLRLLPLRLYGEAVEQLPNDQRMMVAFALATYRAEPPTTALPTLEKAAATTTTDPYLFVALGDCYLHQGLISRAREAYEKGLERAPSSEPLLDRVAELDKALEGSR